MSHDRLKRPKLSFTQVPNELICSPELSCKAKTVYCYLISRPDDWQFYTKEIVKNMKESINTVETALRELISFGWIEKEQIRVGGRFSHSVYTLFYEASTVPQKTVHGETAHDKTVHGKLTPTNTNKTNKENNNTYLDNSSKEDKKLLKDIMKFRVAFMSTYTFDGFTAHGLSDENYDYVEFSTNVDMHIIVKDTNERITKELALEVWTFLYFDFNKPKQLNANSFVFLDYKKQISSDLLLN